MRGYFAKKLRDVVIKLTPSMLIQTPHYSGADLTMAPTISQSSGHYFSSIYFIINLFNCGKSGYICVINYLEGSSAL